MTVTCPKSKKHKKFVTTAHEMHDWLIDENAGFIKDLGCLQVDTGPTKGNIFTCNTCGAEALVQE